MRSAESVLSYFESSPAASKVQGFPRLASSEAKGYELSKCEQKGKQFI